MFVSPVKILLYKSVKVLSDKVNLKISRSSLFYYTSARHERNKSDVSKKRAKQVRRECNTRDTSVTQKKFNL